MSTTTNWSLTKPEIGSDNWGTPLNTNLDVIDLYLGRLAPGNFVCSGTIMGQTATFSGNLNVAGIVSGTIASTGANFTNNVTLNSDSSQTTKVIGTTILSGTTFAHQVEATGINVGGNLSVSGNISGNITDVAFGDITTNSIINTTSVSTATSLNTSNAVISGTVFGQQIECIGMGLHNLTGKLTAGTVEIEGSNFDINGGDISASTISGGLTWSSAQDLNNQALTNINIDSGAIDGATIGANSSSAGTFTNLTSKDTTILNDAVTEQTIISGTVFARNIEALQVKANMGVAALNSLGYNTATSAAFLGSASDEPFLACTNINNTGVCNGGLLLSNWQGNNANYIELRTPRIQLYCGDGSDVTIAKRQYSSDSGHLILRTEGSGSIKVSGTLVATSNVTLNDAVSEITTISGTTFTQQIEATGVHAVSYLAIPSGTIPSRPTIGSMYFDPASSSLKVYNGTIWVIIS